jgi:hypothetical protein
MRLKTFVDSLVLERMVPCGTDEAAGDAVAVKRCIFFSRAVLTTVLDRNSRLVDEFNNILLADSERGQTTKSMS